MGEEFKCAALGGGGAATLPPSGGLGSQPGGTTEIQPGSKGNIGFQRENMSAGGWGGGHLSPVLRQSSLLNDISPSSQLGSRPAGAVERVSSAGVSAATRVPLRVLHLLVGILGDGSEAASHN